MKTKVWILLTSTLAIMSMKANAQNQPVSLEEAIGSALQNNPGLRSTSMEVEAERLNKRTSFEIPKTQAMFMSGQYNSLNKDNNLTITQSIPFPTVFASQSRLGELRIQSSQYKKSYSENELVYQVKQVYNMLHYLTAQQHLLQRQDSIFSDLVRITSLQFKTGESALLQKTSAVTRYNEVQNLMRQNQSDQSTYESQLQILMNASQQVSIAREPFLPLTTALVDDTTQIVDNPQLAYQKSLSNVAFQEKRVEGNKALPDLSIGYFNQTLIGFQQQQDGSTRYFSSNDRFNGFMVGVAIPIWFLPNLARVRTSSIRASATQLHTDYFEKQLYGEWHKAIQQFTKHRNSLNYYTQSALPNARLLLRQSQLAYTAGDISQADHRLNLQQALAIEEGYLQTILQYNQGIITLEFLSGKYSKTN